KNFADFDGLVINFEALSALYPDLTDTPVSEGQQAIHTRSFLVGGTDQTGLGHKLNGDIFADCKSFHQLSASPEIFNHLKDELCPASGVDGLAVLVFR